MVLCQYYLIVNLFFFIVKSQMIEASEEGLGVIFLAYASKAYHLASTEAQHSAWLKVTSPSLPWSWVEWNLFHQIARRSNISTMGVSTLGSKSILKLQRRELQTTRMSLETQCFLLQSLIGLLSCETSMSASVASCFLCISHVFECVDLVYFLLMTQRAVQDKGLFESIEKARAENPFPMQHIR